MTTSNINARSTSHTRTAVVGCDHRTATTNSATARITRNRRLLRATHELDDITLQPTRSASAPAHVTVRDHQPLPATAGRAGPEKKAAVAITTATSRMLRTEVSSERSRLS